MTGLLDQIKGDGPQPRWIQVLPHNRYRLVRPAEEALVSDDSSA